MEKVHDLIPEISILVPVYNVDKYLNRCIESLTNQTLEDIERLKRVLVNARSRR